jgi:hypothetical protein
MPISASLVGKTIVVATAGWLVCANAFAAQSSPFAGMSGVWSGRGTILLADGGREAIRCRATYAVRSDGNALQQTLRCASDSYKFELSSNVVAANGRLSGTWSEATRGVNGEVQGTTSGGRFQVVVNAGNFTASLVLTTRGNSQSVAIRSEGSEFRGANITLSRV